MLSYAMRITLFNPRCNAQVSEARAYGDTFFLAAHRNYSVRRISGIMHLIKPVTREQNNDARLQYTRWWDKGTDRELLLEALQRIAHVINCMSTVSTLLLDAKFPMSSRLRYSEELDRLVEDCHVFRSEAFTRMKPAKLCIYEDAHMTQWINPDPDNYA